MVNEGIYVTLGKAQIDEKKGGYKTYLKDFSICNGERAVYCWRLSKKPKQEFVNVYIVIGNKVRFKARFIGYDTDRGIEFLDGSYCFGSIWLLLIDFERLPRPYEDKKGFQGFRYKE